MRRIWAAVRASKAVGLGACASVSGMSCEETEYLLVREEVFTVGVMRVRTGVLEEGYKEVE